MKEKFKDINLFIFAGGLGSGKSEIAVNFSVWLYERDKRQTYLVDLDIIKPYYRSRHLRENFSGISIVAPPPPYLYADLPLVSPEVNALLQEKNLKNRGSVVIDAGGDDAGSRVLGCFRDNILRAPHQFFFVINTRRPYGETESNILYMVRQIEDSCGLKVTGLINNTHLLRETTTEVVQEGARTSLEVSRILKVPVVFHAVRSNLDGIENLRLCEPVFKLKLYFCTDFSDRLPVERGGLYGENRDR